jgi:hypothetical protein
MTTNPPYCRRCRRYHTAAETIERWHRCEEVTPAHDRPQADRAAPRDGAPTAEAA